MLQCGMKEQDVATKVGVNKNTICQLKHKFQQTGFVKDFQKSGHPKKTRIQYNYNICLQVLRNSRMTAKKSQADLRRNRNIAVSVQTIRNSIRSATLKS